VTTETWYGDSKAACTRPVSMAATRDNGDVGDKLLNNNDDDDNPFPCYPCQENIFSLSYTLHVLTLIVWP